MTNTKSLEEKFEIMEQEIQRLKAVNEIQNVASMYEYIHTPTQIAKSADLFAQHTPGVSVTVADWGTWKGIEGVRDFFGRILTQGPTPGFLAEHHLTTPIIEVARDGKTAKACWFTPGHETIPIGNGEDPVPQWVWGRYRMDFIKEDGKWKIWHLHFYSVFSFALDRDKSWMYAAAPNETRAKILASAKNRMKNQMPGQNPPFPVPKDEHNPYTPTFVHKVMPVPPEPYDTWDE